MSLMAIFSMENFKDTDVLYLSLINTRAILKMGSIMGKESTPGALEMSMKGPIKMEKSTVMEYIQALMDLSIKEIGRTAKGMGKASKYLLLELSKKYISNRVWKSLISIDIN